MQLEHETLRRLEMIFSGSDKDEAIIILSEWQLRGDRTHISALKFSKGDLSKLKEAVAMGNEDWRDLLYCTGFANNPQKHLKWLPNQEEYSWWQKIKMMLKMEK